MKRDATAVWTGVLSDGQGNLNAQSGALNSTPYSFKSRFEDETGQVGTNPEELLAAAHAGCFAMQLAHMLDKNGTPAIKLEAKSVITVSPKDEGGFEIKRSALTLDAHVPNLEESELSALASKAKETCPVSAALGSVDILLETKLSA